MDTLWELAKEVFSGELDLLFAAVALEWIDDAEIPPLVGAGVVRSDSRSSLSLRMEATNLTYGINWPWPRLKAGEEIPKECFVRAVMKDHNGDIWNSSPFPLDINAIYILPQLRDGQPLSSFTRTTHVARNDDSSIRMILRKPPGLIFPRSTSFENKSLDGWSEWGFRRDHEVLTVLNAKLRVRALDEKWIEIRGSGNEPFGEAWVKSLSEALAFVSSYRCDPPAFEIVSDGRNSLTLWHGPFDHFYTRLLGPAGFLDGRSTSAYWGYFARLAEYLLKHPENAEHLAVQFRLIREGSGSSLQTAGLTMAVAIESIAERLVPRSLGEPFPADVMSAVRLAIDSVKMAKRERERVQGTLSSLDHVRVLDRLRGWAKLSNCPMSLITDWRHLRNDAAHGADLQGGPKSWERYMSSMELLYRLVGWAIDYSGPIVAASIPGYPPTEIGSPTATAAGRN
ncbi:MAG: hypothetical protein U0570_03705 [Phycisphaerales bacterium]